MSFVNRRYTKGEPFLSKMVCKRLRGDGKVGGPSLYITLLRAPLARWAIITSRSKKLCVLLLLVTVTFYAFCVFFWYWIGMLPFPLHQSPLSTLFGYYSCDTSRVSVRPMKTFLHDKLKRKFSPGTLWRGICPISWRICKLLAVFIGLVIMGWLNLLTKCMIM